MSPYEFSQTWESWFLINNKLENNILRPNLALEFLAENAPHFPEMQKHVFSKQNDNRSSSHLGRRKMDMKNFLDDSCGKLSKLMIL